MLIKGSPFAAFSDGPLATSVIIGWKPDSKQNVLKKLLIGFSIFVVFSLLVIFGFFSKYNYVTAKLAISKNELVKVNINTFALHLAIEENIGKKYGIRVVNLVYYYFEKPVNYFGIMMFNNCMEKAFIKKYGIAKFIQYRSELDSTCNSIPEK